MVRILSSAARGLAAVALVSGVASAQQAAPPLIDRALFFGDPEISASQLSPDGRYLSFIKPFNGTRNVWVKKADEPLSATVSAKLIFQSAIRLSTISIAA